MNWTLIWFVINMGFVVSIITYMFMHRTYSEAKRLTNDSELIHRANRRRVIVGLLSIVLFIVMTAALVINMRMNAL